MTLTYNGVPYVYYGYTTTVAGVTSAANTTVPPTDPLIASVTQNTTITYLYVRDTIGFKVTKTLTAPAEETEQFVFQIDYKGGGATAGTVVRTMMAVITVQVGQTSATINFVDMPQGWYTVTELNSNFRFELQTAQLPADNPGATIAGRTVTRNITDNSGIYKFTNKRLDVPWANGKTDLINDLPPLTNP